MNSPFVGLPSMGDVVIGNCLVLLNTTAAILALALWAPDSPWYLFFVNKL